MKITISEIFWTATAIVMVIGVQAHTKAQQPGIQRQLVRSTPSEALISNYISASPKTSANLFCGNLSLSSSQEIKSPES